uniref:RNA helicase n=1 Tax=Parasteatoda tepidariorum TaxID=114398 RepID=A0A2L2Y758_PARTP
MEECWDDELYDPSAPTTEYNVPKYTPPAKRWDDNQSNTTWNQSNTSWNQSNTSWDQSNNTWDSENSNQRYVNNSTYVPQGRPSYNDRSQFSNRGPRNFQRDNTREEQDCTEMVIDSNKVGKVIGRGGSKIQELQTESGARIKVLRDDGNSMDGTTVRITGSQESRDAAKKLIEDLTTDFQRFSTDSSARSGERSAYSDSSYADSAPNGTTTFIDWDKIGQECEEARKRKLASLPPIIKMFYSEDPSVTAMSKKAVHEFRMMNNNISVNKVNEDDDRPTPNPVTTFKHAFHPYPELLEELQKQNFKTPSPIQSQAWPILLNGYDMIGIAQTGTGKTIAFLFPALIHIVGQVTPRSQRVGPTCLILAPTRELAQQIESEAKKYTYHDIKCVCIYGGGSRRNQIGVVTKGVDIVIATPGRLNDLVMNKIIDVTGVTYLVLDEADRMLDMGFEPQIRKIVIDIRPDRQTVMTSATWTSEIQHLAARYMTNPFKVNVGALDLAAVHSVTQEIVFAEDEDRREILEEFIGNMGSGDKVIVFVERKCIADDLSSDLLLRGVSLQSIHGDREQCDREQALDDLKTGAVRILIATDVASRGLDIKDITHVFNMYFPRNIEEYVHRVGRTGRAGNTGHAISIFTRQDWMHAGALVKILEEADQFVPDELYEMSKRYKAWKMKKQAEEEAYGGRRSRGGGGGRRRF